jgi:hypothetical protein
VLDDLHLADGFPLDMPQVLAARRYARSGWPTCLGADPQWLFRLIPGRPYSATMAGTVLAPGPADQDCRMDKTSLIRRLAGFCLATVAALSLAVITTTSAEARTTAPQFTTASAPTVVNPGNQRYVEFDPVRLQMTATGGAAPYTWSAVGLSRWLGINAATGAISGIASAGIYTVTVTATDSAGSSGSVTFTITVPRECRTC